MAKPSVTVLIMQFLPTRNDARTHPISCTNFSTTNYSIHNLLSITNLSPLYILVLPIRNRACFCVRIDHLSNLLGKNLGHVSSLHVPDFAILAYIYIWESTIHSKAWSLSCGTLNLLKILLSSQQSNETFGTGWHLTPFQLISGACHFIYLADIWDSNRA